MNTVILTLAAILFITGVSAKCTLKNKIEIYEQDSDTSNCKLDTLEIANNTKVQTTCNVECSCSKEELQCCLERKCTMVDDDCEMIQINTDRTIGCALL